MLVPAALCVFIKMHLLALARRRGVNFFLFATDMRGTSTLPVPLCIPTKSRANKVKSFEINDILLCAAMMSTPVAAYQGVTELHKPFPVTAKIVQQVQYLDATSSYE